MQGGGDDGVGFDLPPYNTAQRALNELLGDPQAIHQEEERWRRRLGLAPTSRESVFVAMRKRLETEERAAAPSKRQLRLAAAIHTALSDAFYKDGLCPVTRKGDGSPLVDITEVRVCVGVGVHVHIHL